MRILDPNGPALDSQNAIRSIAKLKNVAGHTLDGKIFVDTADDVIVGLQYHLVIGGVRNRAAGCQRGRSRSAPGAQHLMNGVAMNKRAAPAAACCKTVSQHLHDGVEIRAR